MHDLPVDANVKERPIKCKCKCMNYKGRKVSKQKERETS